MIDVEQIYLECVLPEKNKQAYYRLIAGRDLFGLKLIRTWGRIGTRERPRQQERFVKLEEMQQRIQRILQNRLSHGYVQKRKVNVNYTVAL